MRTVTDAEAAKRDIDQMRGARGGLLVCAAVCACSPSTSAPDALDRCTGVPVAEALASETGLLPTDLALDDEFVYWPSFRGGAIRRLPKSGDASAQTIAMDAAPLNIAVDAAYVYWLTGRGHVHRCAKPGGAIEVLATGAGCGNSYPCGEALALDEQAIYWAEKGTPGQILRLSKMGGLPMALDATGIMTTNLVVDAEYVYFGALSYDGQLRQVLRRVPKLGGVGETLFAFDDLVLESPPSIALDATHLYVAREGGVWRIAKDGSESKLLAEIAAPRGIAIDGSSVYVTQSSTVEKLAIDGGQATLIACNQQSARSLLLDASRVYWVDVSAETINATAK